MTVSHQQNGKQVLTKMTWNGMRLILLIRSSAGLSRAYNLEGSRNSLDVKPGELSYCHVHLQTLPLNHVISFSPQSLTSSLSRWDTMPISMLTNTTRLDPSGSAMMNARLYNLVRIPRAFWPVLL